MTRLCRRIGYLPAQIMYPRIEASSPAVPQPDPSFGGSPPNTGQNRNQSAGAARYGGGVGKPPYISGPQMTRKP